MARAGRVTGAAAPEGAIRLMTAADAADVAALHARSWQTAYRGIFSDAYLDTDALANRRAHWARRFSPPRVTEAGLVASHAGRLVGFAYLVSDADPGRGTLLDNLHVAPEARGHGLGRRLLAEAEALVVARGWPRGLHLWVYEANAGARRFYERHGGVVVDRVRYDSAEGRAHPAVCYHWPASGAIVVP